MKKEVKKEIAKGVSKFYTLIGKIAKVKRKSANDLIKGKLVDPNDFDKLKKLLLELEKFMKEDVVENIHYEINEMNKDLLYLDKGEQGVVDYMVEDSREVEDALYKLKGKKFNMFISDRDGTINNYCARYKSSIQSIYNALFLNTFLGGVDKKIVVSSAPLGLLRDVNILPEKDLILAGSEGREFLYNGKIKKYPLDKKGKKTLDHVKSKIKKLLNDKEHKKFALIGSGFQEKHGMLTIARQNISSSIKDKESKNLLKKIKSIVSQVDKESLLNVNDTGLDIEIKLKKDKKTEFSKGDGLEFILKNINVKGASVLACGDTVSDLHLFSAAKKLDNDAKIIFVSTDENMMDVIKKIDKRVIFVSSPDVLVTILERLGEASNGS